MANHDEEEFFINQTEASRIKAEIVSKYFYSWSTIIGSTVTKLGYLDFFCGPGKYKDGSLSTPLLILNKVVGDPKLQGSLVTIFQDSNENYVTELKGHVAAISGIEQLKYPPFIDVSAVDDQLVAQLKKIQLIPSLIFVDPFGYNGLSLDLLGTAIKDWGCDCIFFFNYNRINAALNNPVFTKNVNLIFGEEIANKLRTDIEHLEPDDRQRLILDQLSVALKSVNGKYCVLFKFFQEDKEKTSHFLALVTKHQKGYEVMKDVMARVSETEGGVPTYTFHPRRRVVQMGTLFPDTQSKLVSLGNELMTKYQGQIKKVSEIYKEHNVDTPYIPSSYKKAIMILEETGKISVDKPPSARKRIKGELTLGDDRIITFI